MNSFTFTVGMDKKTATDIGVQIRVFVLMAADKKLDKQELYHLYIIRQLYHEMEKKLMNAIFNSKPDIKIKFDDVRAHAIIDMFDSYEESTFGIRNLRMQLGQKVGR